MRLKSVIGAETLSGQADGLGFVDVAEKGPRVLTK